MASKILSFYWVKRKARKCQKENNFGKKLSSTFSICNLKQLKIITSKAHRKLERIKNQQKPTMETDVQSKKNHIFNKN